MGLALSCHLDRDFAPDERALNIDHIHEKIFSSLEINDLLRCRLVSHRWLMFVQKPLEQKTILSFWNITPMIDCRNDSSFWDVFKFGVRPYEPDHGLCESRAQRKPDPKSKYTNIHGKDIKILMRLLNTRQSYLNYWFRQSKFTYVFPFPCTRFEFFKVNLDIRILQEFFNSNGENIQELKLHFEDGELLETITFMNQLCNLLLRQTWNLKHLILFAENTQCGDARNNSSNVERVKIRKQVENLLQEFSERSSLKILSLYGKQWEIFIEFFIQLCPDLEEIFLDEIDYSILLEPVNKLHLLKHLNLNINKQSAYIDIEIFEKISLGNLKIKTLVVNVVTIIIGCIYGNEREAESRLRKVIQRILKSSWDTLNTVEINGLTSIPGGMEWPEYMPELQKIPRIRYTSLDFPVFPQPRRVPKMFMELRFFNCVHHAALENIKIFCDFIDNLDSQVELFDPDLRLVSFTVKRVILKDRFDILKENPQTMITDELFQKIKRICPNARIDFQY